jgi:hypothetical protein
MGDTPHVPQPRRVGALRLRKRPRSGSIWLTADGWQLIANQGDRQGG